MATLRDIALDEIARTRWYPPQGENRITGMIANRPDWVVSRQRAWGVPIAIFVTQRRRAISSSTPNVNARIAEAFETEGADAWFAPGARERFLAPDLRSGRLARRSTTFSMSGSIPARPMPSRSKTRRHFPGLAGIKRIRDGGADEIMYLEGSDQHRGWFQSSLLESCGTRGRAPFDAVLTHGFVLDEKGQKMSKSLGNVTAPQTVIKQCRRRYSAPLGRGLGLFRRSAHRPGNPENLRRDLSQAAQHDPLDARHARALRRRRRASGWQAHAASSNG